MRLLPVTLEQPCNGTYDKSDDESNSTGEGDSDGERDSDGEGDSDGQRDSESEYGSDSKTNKANNDNGKQKNQFSGCTPQLGPANQP